MRVTLQRDRLFGEGIRIRTYPVHLHRYQRSKLSIMVTSQDVLAKTTTELLCVDHSDYVRPKATRWTTNPSGNFKAVLAVSHVLLTTAASGHGCEGASFLVATAPGPTTQQAVE